MTARVDIELQRNADWTRAITFQDVDGEPLDLTGATFEMDVKLSAGDPGAALGSATVTIADAPGGVLEVVFNGADFAAVGGAQESVTLAYDLIATQGGLKMLLLRGAFILSPGVS